MAQSLKEETNEKIKLTKSSIFGKYEKSHELKSTIGKFEWLKIKNKKIEDGLKADKWANVLRYTCNMIELMGQQQNQIVISSNYTNHEGIPPTQIIACLKGDKDALASKWILNLLNQPKPNAPEKSR